MKQCTNINSFNFNGVLLKHKIKIYLLLNFWVTAKFTIINEFVYIYELIFLQPIEK